MGTHLYVCDEGGPLVVATPGTPPGWVTCPLGSGYECSRCKGAALQGEAEPFCGGPASLYACAAGHRQVLQTPMGKGLPESAECPECKGTLLPVGS
jgi:hypothetical protein